MSRQRNQSTQGERLDELTDSITMLSQEVEVLRNVLDEIREDFSWAVRNERTAAQSRPFILKRMAADPTDPRWAERLEVIHADPPSAGSATIVGEGIDDIVEAVDQLADQAAGICEQVASVRERLSESLHTPDVPSQTPAGATDAALPEMTGPHVQRSLFAEDGA